MVETEILINSLRTKADHLGVRKVANFLLDDPRFPLWSGSGYPDQHHHGTGGLITHVSEVVNMCLLMREKWYTNVDEQALFLSALMHDWGKLWDYEPYGPGYFGHEPIDWSHFRVGFRGHVHQLSLIMPETKWQGTTHKRNIHHISRSAIEWSRAVGLSRECEDIQDEVTHAILSHHGQREWGSPVAPNTPLAWLLHCCDIISARMNDCEKMDYVRFRREYQQ